MRLCASIAIAYAAYMAACILLGMRSQWLVSAHMFPIGAIAAANADKITGAMKKHGVAITVAGSVAAVWLSGTDSMPGLWIYCVASAAAVICAMRHLNACGSALRRLGTVSLETYMVQGLFMQGLPGKNPPFSFLPAPACAVAAVAASVAAGYAWHTALGPFRLRVCGRKE